MKPSTTPAKTENVKKTAVNRLPSSFIKSLKIFLGDSITGS